MSKSLTKIIHTIEESPTVKRFKQLEKIIDTDPALKKQHEKVLHLQKKMVQLQETTSSKYLAIKTEYDIALQTLKGHVLMEEYLDLLEEINEDLQLIQTIIEQEINAELE